PLHMLGVVQDIHDRKMAEEALRSEIAERERIQKVLERSEARFRNLATAPSDWVWELDADGRFSYVSEKFLDIFGTEPADVIGVPIEEWRDLRSIALSDFQPLLDAIEARRPIIDLELARSGSDMVVRLNAIPIWEDGEYAGFFGISQDITELKQAQKRLIAAEKFASLGTLVAGVAHEINTPLGISITASSHLEAKAKELGERTVSRELTRNQLTSLTAVIQESAGIILKNLTRAANLVQSFKQVAVDQTAEAAREINIFDYVGEVLRSLSPKTRHTGIDVQLSGNRHLVGTTFPGAIAQILTNLVMNSIIHAFDEGAPGRISIVVGERNGLAVLRYADDGKGMDPETASRVFEPFFTTKRNTGGTGLGMHLTHNLVTQRLGGELSFRTAPGEGVEIEIDFPLT
ncbi:MAG: HAMP domain-containing histidine kinase, partial [Nisaea sp.]|uniref:sensor histidine kinase n=1 Tax=Nisaea sp. TaxID=2024842 RepID=UPI001B241FA3